MPESEASVQHVARQVRAALEGAELAAFAHVLDSGVTWGPPGSASPPCRTREQVLAWYRRGREAGVRAQVTEVSVAGDHIVVGLVVAGTDDARERGGRATRWQVLTVRDGLVVDIVGYEQRREAATAAGLIES